MEYFKRDGDTICALSTARGTGGISVIRVSGYRAESIVRKLCPFLPEVCQSHRIYYGFIKCFECETEIDEVLVSYFAKGRSFTSEQTLEISSHGGDFISQKIILELQKAGARIAEKGEFTYRAFMNGRMDLIQSEGILSIIKSDSQVSSGLALKQLKGHLSRTFEHIEDQLTWILAHLEANIDFASEDIQYSSAEELLHCSLELQGKLDQILSTYAKGRQIVNGVGVSIIGEPNVGKSSLFNVLLEEDRAIVSTQAGTTRDCVEGRLLIEGITYHLWDTAGLRDTCDEIEKLGMEQSLKFAKKSDLVFLVLELAKPFHKNIQEFISKTSLDKLCFVFNKSDLFSEGERKSFLDKRTNDILKVLGFSRKALVREKTFVVSTVKSEGVSPLLKSLEQFSVSRSAEDSAIITQARHFELLKTAYEKLSVAIELLRKEVSPEFIAFELQDSLVSVQQLLGRQYDDEIMDRVFKEFCLGK